MDTDAPSTRLRVSDLVPDDAPAVLALNAAFVHMLSPLDAAGLAALLSEADVARAVRADDALAGFVIALREGRAYGSPNYRWFASNVPCFLYVDRVVVDPRLRGRGVAQALYAYVFARARCRGVPVVACEYDIEPPNPASARFHAAQGFREVARQRLEGGKAVSLQLAEVAPAAN